MPTRRIFLKQSAFAMVGVGPAPIWLRRTAFAANGPDRRNKILVAIFQRGAADGLNMVIPYSDRNYYELRPTIAVPQPGKEGGAIDLDGQFGLHPEMAPLHDLYKQGHLAIVHATGSPNPTRSHFDAQDYMESGTPGVKSTSDGWLNRTLQGGAISRSPLRAVAIGPKLPRTLRGPYPAVALNSISSFELRDPVAKEMFESVYSHSADTQLTGAARETFQAMQTVESINRGPYSPANGAQYPAGRLGQSLLQIARLIKADAGVEVAFADLGGWDHHVNESNQLPRQLREFSAAVAAFCRDVNEKMEDIVLVTMSEFGRTVRENGNRGTDHGHGNVMFVAGGGVRGGRVCGRWPELGPEQLYEGRDLAVTTDFRQVLEEVIRPHLGASATQTLFPGYRITPPSLNLLA